jgi:glycosyltransferase involved in cell wall biosynthesis
MGIPSISSPVGVVNEIIDDGINGFIAKNDDEWIQKISLLIESESLRKSISKNARLTVENNYSLEKASALFINTIVQ